MVANTAKARKLVLDVKKHSHSIKELVMKIVWIQEPFIPLPENVSNAMKLVQFVLDLRPMNVSPVTMDINMEQMNGVVCVQNFVLQVRLITMNNFLANLVQIIVWNVIVTKRVILVLLVLTYTLP